jgi:hypothetical protein
VLLRDAMLYATERIGLTHLAVFLVSGRDGIYTTARGASERSTHTTRPIREARKMRLYILFSEKREKWRNRGRHDAIQCLHSKCAPRADGLGATASALRCTPALTDHTPSLQPVRGAGAGTSCSPDALSCTALT